MITLNYNKQCNALKLTEEIIAAGLPLYPAVGARFYGVSTSGLTTQVFVFDDITPAETTTIDGVVAAHVYTAPVDMQDFKTIEVDFGSTGTRSKNFTITDADVTASSVIIAWQSGAAATGRSADENEMDKIVFQALPAAGSFTLFAASLQGPVSGLYKVNYQILT